MAKGISSEEKIALIKRYLLGERVVFICREAKISRTIFYRWIHLYKNNREYKLHFLFRSHVSRGKNHYRKISLATERKIIRLKDRYSALSLREIASQSGVSHTHVWHLLKKKKELITYKQTRLVPYDKIMMVKQFESGERVSVLCRRFNVSRTIFYRWLKLYKNANEEGRTAELFVSKQKLHYRYAPEVRELAKEIVLVSPRISLRLMREEMIKRIGNKALSRQGINLILKDLHLDSKKKRINFSSNLTPAIN